MKTKNDTSKNTFTISKLVPQASRLMGMSFVIALMLCSTAMAQSTNPDPVDLGTAGNYVLLAKTAISTVPASAITGDVGISPSAGSYITGFNLTDATGYATSPQVT